MSRYIIELIDQPLDWNIDLENFVTALRTKWPNTIVNNPMGTRGSTLLLAVIPIGKYQIVCYMYDGNKQILSFESAYLRHYVKVVVWFRQHVAEKYRLLFYDDDYTQQIELKSDTTELDIRKAML